MIAVLALAALVTALVCFAAVILIGRPEPQARHAAPRPPLKVRIRVDTVLAVAALTAAHAKVNGLLARDEFGTDDDNETVLWVDGLTARPQHGPPAPARRPQALTAAAIIRALPLDAVPHLRRGQYKDGTGTFAAIAAAPAPPALRAHESISLSRADMAAGLAAQHVEEWRP